MLGVGRLNGDIVGWRCDGWMGGLGDRSCICGVIGDARGGLIKMDDLWEGSRACWWGLVVDDPLCIDVVLCDVVVLSNNVVLGMKMEKEEAFDVSGLLFSKRDEAVQFSIGGFCKQMRAG